MEGTATRLRVILVALLALAGAAFAAAPARAHGPTPSEAQFETEFMTETIDHHFAGVKMAELCLEKGTSKQLRDVCSDIAAGQSKEIEVMQRFLESWYDVKKEPELMPADQQMLEELAALEGKAFDIGVSEAFIDHHRIQIERSQVCLEQAFHRALIELCEKQIKTQSREIRVFERVIATAKDNGRGHHHSRGHDDRGHDRGDDGRHGKGGHGSDHDDV